MLAMSKAPAKEVVGVWVGARRGGGGRGHTYTPKKYPVHVWLALETLLWT